MGKQSVTWHGVLNHASRNVTTILFVLLKFVCCVYWTYGNNTLILTCLAQIANLSGSASPKNTISTCTSIKQWPINVTQSQRATWLTWVGWEETCESHRYCTTIKPLYPDNEEPNLLCNVLLLYYAWRVYIESLCCDCVCSKVILLAINNDCFYYITYPVWSIPCIPQCRLEGCMHSQALCKMEACP